MCVFFLFLTKLLNWTTQILHFSFFFLFCSLFAHKHRCRLNIVNESYTIRLPDNTHIIYHILALIIINSNTRARIHKFIYILTTDHTHICIVDCILDLYDAHSHIEYFTWVIVLYSVQIDMCCVCLCSFHWQWSSIDQFEHVQRQCMQSVHTHTKRRKQTLSLSMILGVNVVTSITANRLIKFASTLWLF